MKGPGSVQPAGLYRGRIAPFLLMWRPYPHYSHWTTGWRDRIGKRGSERGVIGVHALCIISYSEEDSAASGNESGRRCTEVNAVNANEGAAFAGRYIWLKGTSHGEHSAVVLSAKKKKKHKKTTQSKGRHVEFSGIFLARLKIKDVISDKEAESLTRRTTGNVKCELLKGFCQTRSSVGWG